MMFNFEDFREQGEQIRSLEEQLTSEKLIHAIMITGEKGTGKRSLALLISAALLCSNGGEKPCLKCENCRSVENMDHPDLIVIRKGVPIASEVKKDRATIPVEDIREMINRTGRHTLSGGARVVMIQDADKMTAQAQNCLLKTLEEPPENTYFILVTDQPGNMLTTVISRCRLIRIHPWPEEKIRQILQNAGTDKGRATEAASAAGGSIGTALELSGDEEYWKFRKEVAQMFFGPFVRSDILMISNSWKDRKQDAEKLFSTLESLLRKLMLSRVYGKYDELGDQYAASWVRFAHKADLGRFVALNDAIITARRQTASSVNFQAVLEQLLFIWMEEESKW